MTSDPDDRSVASFVSDVPDVDAVRLLDASNQTGKDIRHASDLYILRGVKSMFSTDQIWCGIVIHGYTHIVQSNPVLYCKTKCNAGAEASTAFAGPRAAIGSAKYSRSQLHRRIGAEIQAEKF
ncbi:hypothetical protein B0T13DRAFT_446747 [Neurospora crassa]|nr:hypothetical protein B0T13DRAFT_446747 [Neurospora crassa]